MDLGLTNEQTLLKEAARSFVDREAPGVEIAAWFRTGTTFRPDLYRKAADAGWLGLLVPPEVGGAGAELRDCAVVFEQLGRGPVPGPLFSSGVLAPLLIWECGSDEQRDRLIPPLCRGETICAVGLSDDPRGTDSRLLTLSATEARDGFVLSGRKQHLHDVIGATSAIVAADGPSGAVLAVVNLDDDRIEVRQHSGFLASICDLELHSVHVPFDALLTNASPAAIDRALLRALPILAAFQVGACERIFEMTLEYTRDRIVFGQPIGRFQRVQDHCVELVNQLDRARWITYETLWKVDTHGAARAAVHEAKAVAAEAHYQACNSAHKVFAGPGTALDHPLVAHTLTSRVLYQFLGSPTYHKDRMILALVDGE